MTAWNEYRTVPRAIVSIIDQEYSGYGGDLQLIQISPDNKTLQAGRDAVAAYFGKDFAKPELPIYTKLQRGRLEFVQVKDPRKGKPHALNLAFKYVKGDIIVFTDGDVYLSEGALSDIIKPLLGIEDADDPVHREVGAVSGHPVPINPRSGDFMDFMAHAFTYVADRYRKDISDRVEYGENGHESTLYVNRPAKGFVALSGYLYAMRRGILESGLRIPKEAMIDDGYISAYILRQGYKLGYVPEAKVNVKYPSAYHEYLLQRVRNIKGHKQLKHLIELPVRTSRSFVDEVRYLLFPFRFIDMKSPKEWIYAIGLYPLRLTTWIFVWWKTRTFTHDEQGRWRRIESSK